MELLGALCWVMPYAQCPPWCVAHRGGCEQTHWCVSHRRSLFVVLDSLACTDGAISAAAQGWLVRALSLGDVARILEPVLLLLLQPKTQRTSIHCLKQNSAGEQPAWEPRVREERVGGLDLSSDR